MEYNEKMIALILKENAMLWDLLDCKAKACNQLCEIIADMEHKLRFDDAD